MRCSVQSCVSYSLLCSIPEFRDCEFLYHSRTATAVSLTINLTCFFLCTNSSLLLSIVCSLWCKLLGSLMSSPSPWTSHWKNAFIHFAFSPPCTPHRRSITPHSSSLSRAPMNPSVMEWWDNCTDSSSSPVDPVDVTHFLSITMKSTIIRPANRSTPQFDVHSVSLPHA